MDPFVAETQEVIKLQHFSEKRLKKKAKTSSEVKCSHETKDASWHRDSDATILPGQSRNRSANSGSL